MTTWVMRSASPQTRVRLAARLERERVAAGGDAAQDAARDLVELDGSAPQGQSTGVDAGRVEQLGDETAEPVGVGVDGLEHELALLLGEAVPLRQQGRGEPLDSCERRAQLVGDGGDEVGALAVALVAHLRVAHARDDAHDGTAGTVPHQAGGHEVLAPARGVPGLLRQPVADVRPSYGRVESYQLLPFRSSKGIASDRCMPSISPGAARAIRSMRSLTYSTTPSAPAMTTPSGSRRGPWRGI
ncbi:MAG: hypothetical protein PGN15_11315 [Aeromicrobium erythreum]